MKTCRVTKFAFCCRGCGARRDTGTGVGVGKDVGVGMNAGVGVGLGRRHDAGLVVVRDAILALVLVWV